MGIERWSRVELGLKHGMAVLEEEFAGTVETQSGLLADHFAESGLIEQPVGYCHAARATSLVGMIGIQSTLRIQFIPVVDDWIAKIADVD